ncbi:uncharacterized protein METZ01_LOCUS478563, partial [marine metagenome]
RSAGARVSKATRRPNPGRRTPTPIASFTTTTRIPHFTNYPRARSASNERRRM